MWTTLYILILATSLLIIPSKVADMFWIPKEAVFNILGFSLIGMSWISKEVKNNVFKNRWLGLILIYTIVSFGWFFYRPLVFTNENKLLWHIWNIRPTINLILALLLIQTLVEYTDNLRRWVKVAELLCWIAFAFSIYSLLQYFNLDPIFNKSFQVLYVDGNVTPDIRMGTFLGQHTLTANFLAMISPLCLMFKQFRYKVMYMFILISVCLANSALSLVALFAGLAVYLLLTKKYTWLLALFISSIAGTMYLHNRNHYFFSLSGRIEIFKTIFAECKDTFVFGQGLGNFVTHGYIFGKSKVALSAHCEPLQILFEGGAVLVVLVVGYLFSLLKRIIFMDKSILLIGYLSAFVSFLIISLGSFPFRIASMALIGILYIASIETQTIKEIENG